MSEICRKNIAQSKLIINNMLFIRSWFIAHRLAIGSTETTVASVTFEPLFVCFQFNKLALAKLAMADSKTLDWWQVDLVCAIWIKSTSSWKQSKPINLYSLETWAIKSVTFVGQL